MHRRPLIAVFLRITAYYLAAATVLAVILTRAPWTIDYLPVGAAERLFSAPVGQSALEVAAGSIPHATPIGGPATAGSFVYLLLCFVAAIFVAVPVVETYRSTTRRSKGPNPSAVKMILLLPVTVAGLVLIVQNSLALAFSLAGLIAGAGVRFRTQVKDVSDTLFFMVAISIGLASGVGAIGIAVMMSMVFCYASLLIHARQDAAGAAAGAAHDEKAKDDED